MDKKSNLNSGIKKRVIMIGSIPPPYHGSNVYFYNLLNSEIKDHFEISHLDISDHRNMDNLSKLDVTNVWLALKNIFMLKKLIKKTDPELIYIPVASNFLPYLRDGLFILVSSFFSKAEIVIHLHEGNYFRNVFYKNSGVIYKKFIEFSLSKVNTAIVYSENLKNIFIGLVRNIVAFPNGLKSDIGINKTSFSEKGKDNFQINFFGNLFKSKGVLDVLNAAVIVINKRKDVIFNFAGPWLKSESQTKSEAENLIKANKIDSFIKFHGIITEKKKDDYMAKANIFLFPTWYPYEGCPLVIIEAMANGKPVISTKDTGAIPEMVLDGETGILVGKQDPEQIAFAVIKLLENEELRLNMGKKGREHYEKNFTFKKNIDNIISTFKKVIN